MVTRADTNIVLPEESLPTSRMVGLGLQHVIAMFGATVLELWHPWRTRYVALRPPSLDVADVPADVLGRIAWVLCPDLL